MRSPARARRLGVLVAVIVAAVLPLASSEDAWATPPPPPSTSAPPTTATATPSPSAVPTATPTASPSPASSARPGTGDEGDRDAEDADDCGLIDVGCKAKNAVTGWFRDLAADALKPVLGFLADTQLGTPEIDSPAMARAVQVWGTSRTIANTCFVLLVTLAGVLLLAGQTFDAQTTARQVLARLVGAFVAVNTSLILVGYGIQAANGLARAILTGGGEQIDTDTAGRVLAEGIEASINTGGAFLVVIVMVVVVMATVLTFIYVVRLAMIMVLIGFAPLALMLHALPMTDGIARLWWRAITGALAIQVCQSLVFITALQLLLTQHGDNNDTFMGVPFEKSEWVDLLLVIALLYVLIRIPSWVGRTIWQSQPRVLGTLVRALVVYRSVGAAAGAARRAAGTTRTGRTAARRGGRPGGRPGNGPSTGPTGPTRPTGPGNPHGPHRPHGGPAHGHRRADDRNPNHDRHRPHGESDHRTRTDRHRPGPNHSHRSRQRPGHRPGAPSDPGSAPRPAPGPVPRPPRPAPVPVPHGAHAARSGRGAAGGRRAPRPQGPARPQAQQFRIDPPRRSRGGRRRQCTTTSNR